MEEIRKIRVVGSGPIALFICWSISCIDNNIVDIISDRLVSSPHNYHVFVDNNYLSKNFVPNILPSSELLNGSIDLYIICDSPSKSIKIADKIQNYYSDFKVLIVSSYLSDMFGSQSNPRLHRYYAWPLVSVESNNNMCIVSTNLLKLSMYQHNLEPCILKLLDSIFNTNNSISFVSNSRTFAARSVLTFALYSFMAECKTLNDLQNSQKMAQFCTPFVLAIADRIGLSIADFPGFDPTTSLVDQLNSVFTNLIESCLSSRASAHNIFYLFYNKDKLSRYICSFTDYQQT